MKKTRILAIDGGGIKGVISAQILVYLENYLKELSGRKNAKLSDYFDLIGGTSTGSILAALYLCPGQNGTAKYSATDALNLYLEYGRAIFHKKRGSLFGLIGPKYTNKNMMQILTRYLGDVKMSELVKPCLLTSYNATSRKAVFFNSVSSKSDASRDSLVRNAVLASTAAPTYFPPMHNVFPKENNDDCYIDGGVVANNPAMCALIEAMKLPDCNDFNNIYLMSVGSVSNPSAFTYSKMKSRGTPRWAIPMFDILMDGNEQTVDYQLEILFQAIGKAKQYVRLSVKEDHNLGGMDDVSEENIQALVSYGKKIAKRKEKDMYEFAKKIIE